MKVLPELPRPTLLFQSDDEDDDVSDFDLDESEEGA